MAQTAMWQQSFWVIDFILSPGQKSRFTVVAISRGKAEVK
jgi:hypothetical protein